MKYHSLIILGGTSFEGPRCNRNTQNSPINLLSIVRPVYAYVIYNYAYTFQHIVIYYVIHNYVYIFRHIISFVMHLHILNKISQYISQHRSFVNGSFSVILSTSSMPLVQCQYLASIISHTMYSIICVYNPDQALTGSPQNNCNCGNTGHVQK